MQINTDGLILKEAIVGESDRLVTILTRDEGLVRAFAHKAKSLNSKNSSATQLLCYSRLALYKGRDKYIINDAQPVEVFFDLRRDIERLSLAQYFCELTMSLAPEEAPAGDFLRLVLNALHFLAKGSRPNLILKSVVEMRMLSFAGYMPDLVGCDGCGEYEAEPMYFLPRSGKIECPRCHKSSGELATALPPGVLTALRHTIYADFDKLFSFQLPLEGQKLLDKACETYLIYTLERSFPTLDFFHGVAG